MSGNGFQMRIRRMPVPHEDGQRSLAHDAGIAVLEPVVPPAHGLVAPFNLRTGFGVIREGMVPRADDRLEWCFHVFEHPRNGIPIAIEQSADQEAGNLDFFQRPYRAAPEIAIALVLEVE